MTNEIEITLIMLFSGFLFLLLAVIIWNYVWIRKYGGVIPNPQFFHESEVTYFNSKNFRFVVSELWERFYNFEKIYLLRSCGIESYAYLIFQRRTMKMMLQMAVISLIISFMAVLVKATESEQKFLTALYDLLLNNKYINDYTAMFQLVSLLIVSFLHCRNFSQIKNEIKLLYFDRFAKMSREKNVDWLSCRTLHLSGIHPEERNSKLSFNFFQQIC